MANENDDTSPQQDAEEQREEQRRAYDAAQPTSPGVPPITSAPVQGQSASAYVQPSVTFPDGDLRFAAKDAATPYVVGVGHVATNPAQYRIDQEQAAEDAVDSDQDDSDQDNQENS